jgi:hypothetical protein
LIDWLTVLGVMAVFGVLLYQGLIRTWSETGLPPTIQSYLKWEKRHMPMWFVKFF